MQIQPGTPFQPTMNIHHNPKTKMTKHLLMLARHADELSRERNQLPPVPLAEPYQSGWLRSYRLTERAAKRRDAQVLQTILDEIKTTVHCRSKDFALKQRNFRHYSQAVQPLSQGLSRIRHWRWVQLRWPDSWHSYFTRHWHPQPWNARLEFDRPELFEFEITPHMVTHVRQINPELESRIAEIEAEISALGGWRKISRLHGISCRWHCSWSGRLDLKRAKASFAEQMNELLENRAITESGSFLFVQGTSHSVIAQSSRSFKARRIPGTPFRSTDPTSEWAWFAKPTVPLCAA